MIKQAFLNDLGLAENASASEIKSTIEDKKSELEYMIAAIDDKAVRRQYQLDIEKLKAATLHLLDQQSTSDLANNTKNVHHLPLVPKTRGELKRDAIKAKMSGNPVDEMIFEQIDTSKTNKTNKTTIRQQNTNIKQPIKTQKSSLLGATLALVVVAATGVGFLFYNGTLSIPTSKEQAMVIASVEMIRGEISSYQQRTETTRTKLEQNLANSSFKVNNGAFQNLINSTLISELEGKLRMAESFLTQKHYQQASQTFTQVKDSYISLWNQYKSAINILTMMSSIRSFEMAWTNQQSKFTLTRPSEIVLADGSLSSAADSIDKGDFFVASQEVKTAVVQWQKANLNIQSQVNQRIVEQQELIYQNDEKIRLAELQLQNEQLAELQLHNEQLATEAIELKRLADIEAENLATKLAQEQQLEKTQALIKEQDTLSEKLTPVTRVRPEYPKSAIISQIQGWVDIGFTVKKDGELSNLVILEASPRRVFNKAALSAFSKWTFEPLLVNGNPVARLDAKYRVEFLLE